jgi:hypothetical protein
MHRLTIFGRVGLLLAVMLAGQATAHLDATAGKLTIG